MEPNQSSPHTFFQNSIIDRFESGNVTYKVSKQLFDCRSRLTGYSHQSTHPCAPNTSSNRTPASHLDDEIDTLASVQLSSFLVPSIDFRVVDSLDGIHRCVSDERL